VRSYALERPTASRPRWKNFRPTDRPMATDAHALTIASLLMTVCLRSARYRKSGPRRLYANRRKWAYVASVTTCSSSPVRDGHSALLCMRRRLANRFAQHRTSLANQSAECRRVVVSPESFRHRSSKQYPAIGRAAPRGVVSRESLRRRPAFASLRLDYLITLPSAEHRAALRRGNHSAVRRRFVVSRESIGRHRSRIASL